MSMLVFGVNDLAGAVVCAFFSIATVVLLWFTARRLMGVCGSLIATALLGVSPYWLTYSRGMWAEVDSVFFAVLSFYLLLVASAREREARYLLFAGAAAGIAVLCHYRMLLACLPMGLLSLRLMAPGWVKRGLLFSGGVFLVLGAAEFVLRIAHSSLGGAFEFSGLFGPLYQPNL